MSETTIPGLHAPIDPKEWNLTVWQDNATAMISSEPAEENTRVIYSAEDSEQLFEVDPDSLWNVAAKRLQEATSEEADEDDIEEALEPIAQATAAKLVLAYQCHDELVEALEKILRGRRNAMQAASDGNHELFDAAQEDIQDAVAMGEAILAKVHGEEAPDA